MFEIIKKEELNQVVTLMEIKAESISKNALPGQFIILRVDEKGERIPLTIADCNNDLGTITIIFQVVGKTTKKLNLLKQNDFITDVVGPLGKPANLEGLNKVCIVGGGVGSAICLPIAKALKKQGVDIEITLGFRNKDLVILEKEFNKLTNKLHILTDDGSYGEKGLVTDKLNELLEKTSYDNVIAIGPLIMMKYVTVLTKEFKQPTTVSMNPVMIDGTGMCGGCRISVNGNIKFACIDGPEFDAFSIDFDEAIARNKMYKEREKDCNLFYEKN